VIVSAANRTVTSTSTAGLIHSALESDRWLKVGDVVEIEFDRIGTLCNRVVKPAA
jgi:2-keto-4-pentenoate hydratase/2-oxohepta-3-ene-1,7-dioic acid hydratase in catechol pathway